MRQAFVGLRGLRSTAYEVPLSGFGRFVRPFDSNGGRNFTRGSSFASKKKKMPSETGCRPSARHELNQFCVHLGKLIAFSFSLRLGRCGQPIKSLIVYAIPITSYNNIFACCQPRGRFFRNQFLSNDCFLCVFCVFSPGIPQTVKIGRSFLKFIWPPTSPIFQNLRIQKKFVYFKLGLASPRSHARVSDRCA